MAHFNDGNKHAIGNTGGRPPKYDKVKIANDLMEWIKLPDSINMCGFCADYLIDPQYIINTAREDSEFSQVYRAVKVALARRRENKVSDGSLHKSAYDLNINVYDLFRKDEFRDQASFEAKITNQQTVTHEVGESFSAIMSQLTESKASRKTDLSNNSTESKS